jgi:hypothetical protein
MTTATAAVDTDGTGTRREMARYRIASGERAIHAQRVDGAVRLTDKPAAGSGRSYLIESDLHVMVELEAIVADYLEQAAIWNVIPAAGSCPLLAEAREPGQ